MRRNKLRVIQRYLIHVYVKHLRFTKFSTRHKTKWLTHKIENHTYFLVILRTRVYAKKENFPNNIAWGRTKVKTQTLEPEKELKGYGKTFTPINKKKTFENGRVEKTFYTRKNRNEKVYVFHTCVRSTENTPHKMGRAHNNSLTNIHENYFPTRLVGVCGPWGDVEQTRAWKYNL